MNVRIEQGDGCRRTVHASAAASELAQETAAVTDDFRTANVPGFRKGKAPLTVIRKRFQREIAHMIGERAAIRLLGEVLTERDIERAGPTQFKSIDFDPESGLTFTAEFDLMPAIEVPDFKSFLPSANATDDASCKDELSEFLLGSPSFDLPLSLVEQEVDFALERDQEPDDACLRAEAERRVKLLLVLQAIAKTEGVEVDDQDVDDRICQMAADSGSSPQALRTELEQKNGVERLRLFLLAEQTMDYILSLSAHP